MRVVFVVRDIKVASGIYGTIATYLRSRQSATMHVELVTFRPPEPVCKQELDLLGVPVHVLDDHSFAPSLNRLRKVVKHEAIDVVVGTTWKTYIIAKLATLGTRAKSVSWLHSIPCVIEGIPRTVLFRFFSRRDPIIFASGAVRKKHRFPGHQGQEFTVYNGLEPLPKLYMRSFLPELGVPADAFVLGYIAEFKAWKNHVTLLQAFQRLLAEQQNLHLILIGVGENFSSTVDLARQLNLSDHVHFLQRRVDARQILGTLDVYVHPSNGEAFGLALAEAMSAGLPVVAADAGALPELVRNEIDGLLFPPLDVDALFQALSRLIGDPNLRMSLGANAQHRIAENFSAGAFSKALAAALEQIHPDSPPSPQRLALTVEKD